MTQPAKVQEPSMEEILASIRRIIADDEPKPADNPPAAAKPAVAPVSAQPPQTPPGRPAPSPAAAPQAASHSASSKAASNSQDDIDALLAGLDADTSEAEVRPPPPEAQASDDPSDEVFELTDDMALPDMSPPTSFQKIDAANDVEFAETSAPAARRVESAPRPERAGFEHSGLEHVPAAQPMLSQSTASAVESAFSSLANTVLSNNARTLEDLVREMLRPMLKSWLDDNLPGLVERIVRAEIERVSRGR
jgi:cell pole-organizing protein PopZ